jgi:4-amino-4-deoxy-L-arabinose transferase-like glycosyltransferase
MPDLRATFPDDLASRGPHGGVTTTPGVDLHVRSGARWDRRLLWILVAAAVVRLFFFYGLAELDLRVDEVQYQEIAVNLVEGRGFVLDDRLTSWRPPFYPFALAALYTLVGTTDPTVARVAQAILSLLNCVLVYALGRRLFGATVGLGAAAIFAFYPSFLFYNNHILTEVLFTFLLTLTGYCFVAYLAGGRASLLAATGVVLGLTVLTRDTVWPLLGVMVLLAWYGRRPGFRTWVAHSAVLVVSFLVVVTPWAVRNTRVQGTPMFISPLPGIAFFAGNYEHTPLDRPWHYHTFKRDHRWRGMFPQGLTEGEQQKFAFRKGLEFVKANPGLTLRRAVVKAANLWGLERSVVGVLVGGRYGLQGRAAIMSVTAAILAVHVLVILAGMTGLCFALAKAGPAMPFHLLFVASLALFTLAHAAAYGHPRYLLPFTVFFSAYAAYAWTIRHEIWERRRSGPFTIACLLAGLLVVIWGREVFVVDLGRFVDGLRLR